MNPQKTQFYTTLRRAKKAGLSRAAKESMREDLLIHIQKRPEKVRSNIFGLRENEQGAIVSSIVIMNKVFFGVLVVMLVGGGVSLAAENAVPGDALYPVKVGVNERVRSFAAVSNEAEARLHAVLAERRLEEAARLALRGGLDARSQAEIEKRFERHVKNTQQSLQKMEKEEFEVAIRLSSDLEAALAAKEGIFLRITEGREAEENGMIALVEKIRDEKKVVASMRVEHEGRMTALADENLTASTTAQRLSEEARGQFKSETERFEKGKTEIESGMQRSIDSRFSEANELITKADEKFEAGEFQEAIKMYRDARQKISEAQAMARTSVSLRLHTHLKDKGDLPSVTVSTGDELATSTATTTQPILDPDEEDHIDGRGGATTTDILDDRIEKSTTTDSGPVEGDSHDHATSTATSTEEKKNDLP